MTFTLSYTNTNPQPSVDERKMMIEFLIHTSPLDRSPTIAKRESAHRCALRY